ncbi:MAG: exosortase/archaeosortase family protein [Chloroflexi bacterium]|nr:exosortase/archaeosortase family protein [Chloroflexota bacterium]
MNFINLKNLMNLETKVVLWLIASLAISVTLLRELWAGLWEMLSPDWIFGQYHASPWAVLSLCLIWLYLRRRQIWGEMLEGCRVSESKISGGKTLQTFKPSKLYKPFNFLLGLALVAGAVLMPAIQDFLVFRMLLALLGVFVIFFGRAARLPSILLGIYGFAISFPLLIERFAELPYALGAIKPMAWVLTILGYPLHVQGQLLHLATSGGEAISVAVTAACAGPATMGVFLALFVLMMLDTPLPPRKAAWVFLIGVAGTWLQNFVRLVMLMAVAYYLGEKAMWTAHLWTIYVVFPLWYLLFAFIYFHQAGGRRAGRRASGQQSRPLMPEKVAAGLKTALQTIVLLVLLAALPVVARFTTALANPDRILEPGFETVTSWTYSETDIDYTDGAQSTAWTTQGTYSYLLSAPGNTNIGNSKYTQILQSVNFTPLDRISFDARLSAGTNVKFEARVMVGTTIVWSQAITTTATSYLHNEIDVSSYTGSQNLIFQVITVAAANNIAMSTYYDNIKLWGSHSDSARTTVANTFASYGDIVYMYGEGFDTTGTYKVAYYDGGTINDGVDGAKLQTDTYTDDADGVLDLSQVRPADYSLASYGTWNAVVYKTTGTMPASYDLVSKADAAYVVSDSFTVQQAAIPEFSTVMAAIAVAGLCSGVYLWMRRRQRQAQVLGAG